MCMCVYGGVCVCADSNPHVHVTGKPREEGGMSRGNWECQAFYLWDPLLCSSPRCGHPLSDLLLGTQGVCGPADILGSDDPPISPALPAPHAPLPGHCGGNAFFCRLALICLSTCLSLWPAAATLPSWPLQSKDPRSWAFLKVDQSSLVSRSDDLRGKSVLNMVEHL